MRDAIKMLFSASTIITKLEEHWLSSHTLRETLKKILLSLTQVVNQLFST